MFDAETRIYTGILGGTMLGLILAVMVMQGKISWLDYAVLKDGWNPLWIVVATAVTCLILVFTPIFNSPFMQVVGVMLFFIVCGLFWIAGMIIIAMGVASVASSVVK